MNMLNSKQNSLPLKTLLITLLNTRINRLEKNTQSEMKQITDFTSQMKSMKVSITQLTAKSASLLALATKPLIKPTPTYPKGKETAMRTLKHDKSVRKLVKADKFDMKNKPEPKRIRAFTTKKKPIKKKDADFEEIVRMHMIDFNRIEDDFSELKGNTTIQNDTMNINISLIDNDIDYFTNDFDKNEEEAITHLGNVKNSKKRK